MALSGSYDFNETCSQIVTDALLAMGQLGRGDTASDAQLAEGRNVLNKMVKMWQGRNVFLWTLEWVQHVITVSSEVVGTDGENYTCILGHTAAASNRPITGTNWTSFWYKYGSSGLTWNLGSDYTSAGDWAVGNYRAIEQAFIRRDSGDIQLPVVHRREFFNIDTKISFGTPEALYFNPLLTVKAYVRPIPIDINDVIHYSAVKTLQDFDADANDADFPSTAFMALSTNLAYWWAPNFGIDPQKRAELKDTAKEAFRYLNSANKEVTDRNGIKPAWRIR